MHFTQGRKGAKVRRVMKSLCETQRSLRLCNKSSASFLLVNLFYEESWPFFLMGRRVDLELQSSQSNAFYTGAQRRNGSQRN
jgi:hypothetical protein